MWIDCLLTYSPLNQWNTLLATLFIVSIMKVYIIFSTIPSAVICTTQSSVCKNNKNVQIVPCLLHTQFEKISFTMLVNGYERKRSWNSHQHLYPSVKLSIAKLRFKIFKDYPLIISILKVTAKSKCKRILILLMIV